MSYGSDEDRRAGRIAIGIVAGMVVAGGIWWWWSQRGGEEPAVVATEPQPVAEDFTPADLTPAPVQHPIDVPAEQPVVDDAPPPDPDVVAQEALGEVLGPAIAGWLVNEQLARRLVATVDNLPRNTRIEPLRPLRAPPGPFVVERETVDAAVGEERIVLSEANFTRYDAIVSLLAEMDPASAAATYRRIYPQLQAGYEELGYPGSYFNDRVVAVIDHLLATPEPQGPLLLEQPKVLYLFEDADLEALSPGQKLLLRIGPAHARTVKQKLGELRALLATSDENNNKE